MNKVPGTKATNTGRPDTPADAALLLMTVIAPAGGDLSERGRYWQQENRAAIDCYNKWIAEHGLPLEEFRRF
jgi:hypothetical protein